MSSHYDSQIHKNSGVFVSSALLKEKASVCPSLKVTSVDITTKGLFLIGCFKVLLHFIAIGWTNTSPQLF